MKKISCILLAVICIMTSFSVSAASINNITRTDNLLVVNGEVDYENGVDKAHIFVLKEGKSLEDLLTAEDSGTVMDFVDDITVSPDSSRFSKTIEVDSVDENAKVIVAYNGEVTDTILGEHINYEGTNIYLTGNVTYADGADTATLEVLDTASAVVYTKTVKINKSNGVYSAFISGETEVTDENTVKVTYNGSETSRALKKSEIVKVVEYSSDCFAQANELATTGFSVMIKLPEGKMSPMQISNSALEAADGGVVIFKGNNTTISSRTTVPLSAFEKVTDSALTERIPADAQGKVYALDLAAAGITGASVTSDNVSLSATELYLNNNRQELSKYPNSGYIVLSGVSSVTAEEVTTTTYNYASAPFENWKNANSAIVEGYIGTDWYIDAADINPSAADTAASTVSFTTALSYEAADNGKVVYRNLLEEIDLPGEWCLDNENQIIYYYMPDGISETDVIELAVSATPALSLDSSANNLWFDGITFEGSTEDAVKLTNVNNVKFTNNVFENGNDGIDGSGNNITVENNEFVNFKNYAIRYTAGGNSDSYTKSNTKISENYFYNCASDNHNPAVLLAGSSALNFVGAEFSNNIVHGSAAGLGLRYNGIDVEVSNNEFYNLIRYGADAGVIYSGRSLTQFGSVVKNNYIHDFGPEITDFIQGYSVNGVYMDDWMSGQTILGNLIVPNNDTHSITGVLTFGAYTTAIGNVTVGANTGVKFHDRNLGLDKVQQAYDSFNYIEGKDAYLAQYPQITALKNDIDTNGAFRMIGNKATDNIGYNLGGFGSSSVFNEEYGFHSDTAFVDGTFEKEFQITDTSIFVDAEGGDYRVKSAAISGKDYYSEYTPDESTVFGFDSGKVSSDFAAIYPASGAELESGDLTLYWEQARYADSYAYEIASDSAFTNVVKSGTTAERLADVSGLANGSYYLRIKAVNNSVRAANEWYSEVTAFTVGDATEPPVTSKPDYDITDASASVSGTSATVAYTFVNNVGDTGTYKLFVAVFNTDGVLEAVKTADKDKATTAVSETFDFGVDLTGKTVKAFIWSDDTNIRPLTKSIGQ